MLGDLRVRLPRENQTGNVDGDSAAEIGVVTVNVYGVTFGSNASAYTVAPVPHPSEVPLQIQLGHGLAPRPERFLSAFTNEYRSFGAGRKFQVIEPNGSADQSFAFAVTERDVDVLDIRYTICWSYRTAHVWHEPLAELPDGSCS